MWKSIQCAVQGRGHIASDTPCQDKTFSKYENGVYVIALADGAGSAKLSQDGAECVTKFICEDLTINFDVYFNESDGVKFKQEILQKINDELENLSKLLECEKKDLASTLLVTAIKDNEKYIVLHIGDGVIGCVKDGSLKTASVPENGEFVNETVFTTSHNAIQTMKVLKGNIGTISGFVLMSDGTEFSLYNKKEKTLSKFIDRIMKSLSLVEHNFLEQKLKQSFEKIIKQNTSDDCSIIFIAKEENEFIGYEDMTLVQKIKLFELVRPADKAQQVKKAIKRLDVLLQAMQTPKTLKELAHIIHLKDKLVYKKYIPFLLKKQFITKENDKYKTVLIMKKPS